MYAMPEKFAIKCNFWTPTPPPFPWEMAQKGQKITFSKNLKSGGESSKMVWVIKIAHCEPGLDGVGPVLLKSAIFEKMRI